MSLDSNSNHSLDHTSNHSASSFTYGGCVLFPWKLHEMLDAAEERKFTSVVSWLPDSKSFKVHDKETFVSLIMPQFFEQTKYKSFQRQLNMWGFERILDGPGKAGYEHPAGYFVRGEASLCTRMTRHKKKSKAKASRNSSNASTATPKTVHSSATDTTYMMTSSSSKRTSLFSSVFRRASRASLVITKAVYDQLEAFDLSLDPTPAGEQPHEIEPEPYAYPGETMSSSAPTPAPRRSLLRQASRASVVITKALHDQLQSLDEFMMGEPTPEEDGFLAEYEYNIDHPPMVRCITADNYDGNASTDTFNSEDSCGDESGDDDNGCDEFAEFAGNASFNMVDEDMHSPEGPDLRRLSSIGKRIFMHKSTVSAV